MDWSKKSKDELIAEIDRLKKKDKENVWGDLMDHCGNLIMHCDDKGHFVTVNEIWTHRMGYALEELIKLKYTDLIHFDFRDTDMVSIQEILQGKKKGHRTSTALVTKDNRNIYLEGWIAPEMMSTGNIGFSAIFHDISEKVRAEKALELYCNITNLTFQNASNEFLFKNIHYELNKIIDSKNFYIALFDKEKDGKYLMFPYYVDEYFKEDGCHRHRKYGKGLTEYTMSGAVPRIIERKEINTLLANEEIIAHGLLPHVWLGVPLKLENEIIGLVAVQGYDRKTSYTESDLELLDFISGQIALAIEKNEQERRLNNQTARLNAIFESSSHLIWSVNKSLELTSFNQNYFDAIFQNYDEKPDITYEEQGQLISVPYDDFWAKKYQLAFKGEALNFEIELTNQNDQKVWKEIFLNPIYQSDGRIDEISGIAHDISSKKQSELALQESEAKFRTIFESFQDLYFRCSFSGVIHMVSPSVKEVMGFCPEEVIGNKITDYYRYTPKTKFIIVKLLSQKGIKNFEVSLLTKSGEVMQYICNIRMVYDKSGIPIAIEGVARDISDLKRVNEELVRAKELAEKSLKVKEQFLANMSHEIRTPMNGIIGMIDLLAKTKLDTVQTDYVDTIKMSSETLLDILNDILDLSKIEAGKMKINKSPVSMPHMMNKLVALFSQQASEKNITLDYQIQQEVPEVLVTDETRLLQILSNLTSNALKFTRNDGAVHIILSRVVKKGNWNTLKLEVKDNGIGISGVDRKKLFNNFTQLDSSSTKKYEGTGLGLVISKNLSKLLGGEIGFDSEEGHGSTFWFTFKAETNSSLSTRPKTMDDMGNNSEITFPLRFNNRAPQILIVDDNMVNRKVSSEILKNAGCKVSIAIGGNEAVCKAAENEYDLIFMDIQMPGMDGVTATKLIKDKLKKKCPPIVAMTAYSMEQDEGKFINAGMDDYISKPIKATILIDKVVHWMKGVGRVSVRKHDKRMSNLKIINKTIVTQLLKYGSNDMLEEAYASFDEESEEQIQDCWNSFKNNDYKEILSKLHTLKGNAGTLGVEKVSFLAESIEKNVKSKDYSSLKKDLLNLAEVFLEYKNNISKILNH